MNWLKPNWETNFGIQNISINYLHSLQIKALILDVDGTLIPRNEIEIHHSVKDWVKEAREHLTLHLLSNNPSKRRIEKISKELKIDFTCRASKPRRGAILKVIDGFNCNKSHIAIIGDRIFTDVFAGNRIGLYTILVKPLKADGTAFKQHRFQNLEKYLSKIAGAYKE